jgi:cytochrome c2
MRKLFKILAYALGGLLLLALAAAAFIHFKGVPRHAYAPTPAVLNLRVQPDSARVERGAKIAALLCTECHSDTEGKLSGHIMLDLPKEFGQVASYNITQDKTHGIGAWTDGELYYFLRTGIRKDGSWAPPYMPKFPLMADEDLYAVIAWLRSDAPRLAPSSQEYPPNKPNFLIKLLSNTAFSPPPMPAQPIAMPDTTDKIALGRYVADGLCACFACHSADFKTMNYLNPERSEGYYGGGNPMLNYDGQVVPTANITMDPETGIGNWTATQFRDAVRYNKKPSGQPLNYPMFPHTTLSDTEVDGIFAYLQTVPKIKNKVNKGGG